MSHVDEECLKLGREILRMIREIREVSRGETGYARRRFTYPGGEVHMLLMNDSHLADAMESTADAKYHVQSVTPPSQRN